MNRGAVLGIRRTPTDVERGGCEALGAFTSAKAMREESMPALTRLWSSCMAGRMSCLFVCPVGMTIASAARAISTVCCEECGGPSRMYVSKRSASARAVWETAEGLNLDFRLDAGFCAVARPCRAGGLLWVSQVAIFTVTPFWANSRARRRALIKRPPKRENRCRRPGRRRCS